MFLLKSYIDPQERRDADRRVPRLAVEGLLLGGSGLGIFALIFEIASDAFSVAAYQTLLAIEGAHGYHEVAMLAFATLAVMLFFGIVPAYKAGAYLKPNAGGSGPLVEAIGPARMRWLSWVGTSMFFIDAVLTIIISSIAATDATLLIIPELAPQRVILAEIYAFFIMAVLVAVGPKRAVPMFLLGGGAFTVFTLFALSYVSFTALTDPSLGDQVGAIVHGLESSGVVAHTVPEILEQGNTYVTQVARDIEPLTATLFLQYFLRSMSSAMLGFSGYEVIPASGKHAARPKWKVINTALILAAIFLIGTGIMQLFAAQQWNIPATEGYSTLLIQFELVFGTGSAILLVAGVLLAIILLLAQGGGYVGGAAVAANAARLGRLPRAFEDDRVGIVVIWIAAAIFIPAIPSVTLVESYYAFGFVSAFVITSTTIFFVRDDILLDRGIQPGSPEAKSLRFAGLRGMVASYIMAIVLVTQKTNALPPIIVFATLITLFQLFIYRGGVRRLFPITDEEISRSRAPGRSRLYGSGNDRAMDEARQHGIAELVEELISSGALVKFNVAPDNIRRLVSHTHDILPITWEETMEVRHHGERFEEPSVELEKAYDDALAMRDQVMNTIEYYSHYGIFTFIDKYSHNWTSHCRTLEDVRKAMLRALFPRTPLDEIWEQFQNYTWQQQPEEIWQFARQRYVWSKDQWPNVSGRITTVWTMQDLDLLNEGHEDLVEKIMQVRPVPVSMEEQMKLYGNGDSNDETSSETEPDSTEE